MKWGVEFWLRVVIAAAFAAVIIAAPSVLFPFVVSLIITTLLNPVAHAVYGQAQKMGWKKFPKECEYVIIVRSSVRSINPRGVCVGGL